MSGAFAQIGRVNSKDQSDSVSIDLQIDDREGDRVLLMALPGQVSLTVPEALKVAALLMEAANRLLEIRQDRASAESAPS